MTKLIVDGKEIDDPTQYTLAAAQAQLRSRFRYHDETHPGNCRMRSLVVRRSANLSRLRPAGSSCIPSGHRSLCHRR